MRVPKVAVLPKLPPERFDLAQRFEPFDDLVQKDLQPLDVNRLR